MKVIGTPQMGKKNSAWWWEGLRGEGSLFREKDKSWIGGKEHLWKIGECCQPKMAPSRSMRLLAWNCWGLGDPSTISQLKESVRLYLPNITFISETKQKNRFVNTVCRMLKCKDRWEVDDPIGKRGGLLIFWEVNVRICQIVKSDLCIKVECEGESFEGKCWIIFIYLYKYRWQH